MQRYALSHLADSTLTRALDTVIAHDCASTADVLAHIAEFDARKLYLPAGYPSMFTYCVDKLHLCEQAAYKRIQAARAARRFPAIFHAVADGQLHLSAAVLLAPHLTEDTAEELLAAATYKSKAQIERLLAERFPRPDVLAWVAAVPAAPAPPSGPVEAQLSPGIVEGQQTPEPGLAPPALGHVGDRPRVKPLSPQSFAVQFTLSRSAHEKLRYAQELLGHQIPSGDIAVVFERALDALIPKLEQARFAATAKARPRQGCSTDPRSIPAGVKRAVWKRDRGRCTFVSAAGQRCPARTRLEFDHVLEVARGGEATVSGLRLRCRPHNQFAAERTFGPEFMRHKRLAAAEARATAKVPSSAPRVQATGGEQATAARVQAAATAHTQAVAAERVAAVLFSPDG